MNFISPIIEDCNHQLKLLRRDLSRFKKEMKSCGGGTLEFLTLQVEDTKSRIRFHAGVRASVVRNLPKS